MRGLFLPYSKIPLAQVHTQQIQTNHSRLDQGPSAKRPKVKDCSAQIQERKGTLSFLLPRQCLDLPQKTAPRTTGSKRLLFTILNVLSCFMQHHRKINSPVSLLKSADALMEYKVDHYGEKSFWGKMTNRTGYWPISLGLGKLGTKQMCFIFSKPMLQKDYVILFVLNKEQRFLGKLSKINK